MKELEAVLARVSAEVAGVRLWQVPGLEPLLSVKGSVGQVAAGALGSDSFPVRAILFDKTPGLNWSLAWHQDRTIVVKKRHDVAGFGPWTIKQGLQHVAPPITVLESMVTIRVHLDPVSPDNAPLKIAPGSHRFGRIEESRISEVVNKCGTATCLADRGDVWLYSTPILHSSEAARVPARRRVLQIDYAACKLPGGLEWAGIG